MTITILYAFLILTVIVLSGAIALYAMIRERDMQVWLPSYYYPTEIKPKIDVDSDEVHVFIAVCDHYEPEWGNPDRKTAIARVDRWCRDYPALFSRFEDRRGRVPQHTFFFPQDQYDPAYLDRLAKLCKAGYGDVDVHLHHDRDTPIGLFEKLDEFRETLYRRHELLRLDPLTGEIVYGFIHGNWALCNSRADGRGCGIDHEIPILLDTGCYADFTMPSAPSETQTRTINSIYYAVDCPGKNKSHDHGLRAGAGKNPPQDGLLMVQGPLLPDWQHRKFGVLPRIENGDLHVGRPPTWERMKLWMNAHVHVEGRPDWLFVKLHTHGCKPGNIDMLLGREMQAFHQELAEHGRKNPQFHYHYVTAWEMAQLVHQAENGLTRPDWDALTTGIRLMETMV
ncbi:MAG: hypothetical protein ACKVT0_12855 [Planctomycetaceae bacterium]